ncbi:hypothetical protein EW146_g9620 [Bondarzewia mesenterica]|uniref:Uncharacterized protein n=1 Tax=Bondarzewia mesenterica TaxID=1095465 RepID=A0A4S4L4P0_9AGAM|nr:hypothetical protein EW146_g9620 [Bondarzewia mesenterica]
MPVETKTVPFSVLNVFMNSVAGGNLAAVVFISPGSFSTFTDEALLATAKNLNQPITTFISPAAALLKSATFNMRWFTPCREVPMRGHSTLAAAQAILMQGSLLSQFVAALRFVSNKGQVAIARHVEDGKIEIALDAGSVTEVAGVDAGQLRTILARALGDDIEIRFMGRGLAGRLKLRAICPGGGVRAGSGDVLSEYAHSSQFLSSCLESPEQVPSTIVLISVATYTEDSRSVLSNSTTSAGGSWTHLSPSMSLQLRRTAISTWHSTRACSHRRRVFMRTSMRDRASPRWSILETEEALVIDGSGANGETGQLQTCIRRSATSASSRLSTF